MHVSTHSMFSFKKNIESKKQNMLSTLRRPIVNIFFVLKYSKPFLTTIQLKFVNSETTIKLYSNFTKKKEVKESMACLI